MVPLMAPEQYCMNIMSLPLLVRSLRSALSTHLLYLFQTLNAISTSHEHEPPGRLLDTLRIQEMAYVMGTKVHPPEARVEPQFHLSDIDVAIPLISTYVNAVALMKQFMTEYQLKKSLERSLYQDVCANFEIGQLVKVQLGAIAIEGYIVKIEKMHALKLIETDARRYGSMRLPIAIFNGPVFFKSKEKLSSSDLLSSSKPPSAGQPSAKPPSNRVVF